jgi:hypothetical protein
VQNRHQPEFNQQIYKTKNKMKKLSIAFAVLATGFLFSSCKKVVGEGPIVTENRPVGEFSSIALSISGELYYTQSATNKLEISAQQNILNVIDAHIVNHELVIKIRDGVRIKNHESIVVNVSCPTIDGLRISGSGNIHADSTQTDNMHLTLSGSGNINLGKLLANSLDANISGSGNIVVSGGAVDKKHLNISGSGGIDTRNVFANDVKTITSGSGEMHVNAAKTLDATISGSGSVYYTGTPVVDTHISGSGKVVHQ